MGGKKDYTQFQLSVDAKTFGWFCVKCGFSSPRCLGQKRVTHPIFHAKSQNQNDSQIEINILIEIDLDISLTDVLIELMA